VSVNVSSRQLTRPDFVRHVQGALAEAGLEPHRLKLEVTESILMINTEQVLSNIRQLVDLGIQLYIDDFGTGYSALSYLQKFPFHTIKIDRSFIDNIDLEDQRSEVVHSILRFTHDLGLSSIAEGVETRGQLERLKELGCQYAQGYYIARPMEPADVEAALTGLAQPGKLAVKVPADSGSAL
jgi:EAL domain-containing protein (putative c-di-GMP-specific phosphodiesterase class I)